jgi:hypothetical protein
MARPLSAEFLKLPLEIGTGLFELRSMTHIVVAGELPRDVRQGQAKALFLPLPLCRLPRQARLFTRTPGGCFVLLRFHRLAFPTPGHGCDYNFLRAPFCDPFLAICPDTAIPTWEDSVRKTDIGEKSGFSLAMVLYNSK